MNGGKSTRLNGWQWLGNWLIVLQVISLAWNFTHGGIEFPIIAEDGLAMSILLSISYLIGTLVFAEIGLLAILYGGHVKKQKAKQDAEKNSVDF